MIVLDRLREMVANWVKAALDRSKLSGYFAVTFRSL
jgi:hypothetical protein